MLFVHAPALPPLIGREILFGNPEKTSPIAVFSCIESSFCGVGILPVLD
ncbi:peptidase S9 prolyl oligopeptidase [Scytonema sp. HK-05]|nr:hypothetical protein [Scytonema sp. HK-05]BAY45256.1 peptidase S9 prolyl oligopeptidase [Scytonema sp. HK-05]